ncbi:hypothetical protein Tco_0630164 [Tanacetum coccineum]
MKCFTFRRFTRHEKDMLYVKKNKAELLGKVTSKVGIEERDIESKELPLLINAKCIEDLSYLSNKLNRTAEAKASVLCVELKAELSKKNEMVEKDAPDFPAFFEINELKPQLKAKDNSISKLKDHIATLKDKRVISSTSARGSKPLDDIKKNRILRSTSSNKKNKVEDHLKSVKPSLNKKNLVFEHVCNADDIK